MTNSVEVEVGESHHGGVLPVSYVRDLSASLDKFILERGRGLVVAASILVGGEYTLL